MIFIGSVGCGRNYSAWFVLVSGIIYGAEWVLMGVVLLWTFGMAVACGVAFCEVCNHCRCEWGGSCCSITVEDSDDCGWWCVLKGVVYGCVVWFPNLFLCTYIN